MCKTLVPGSTEAERNEILRKIQFEKCEDTNGNRALMPINRDPKETKDMCEREAHLGTVNEL